VPGPITSPKRQRRSCGRSHYSGKEKNPRRVKARVGRGLIERSAELWGRVSAGGDAGREDNGGQACGRMPPSGLREEVGRGSCCRGRSLKDEHWSRSQARTPPCPARAAWPEPLLFQPRS